MRGPRSPPARTSSGDKRRSPAAVGAVGRPNYTDYGYAYCHHLSVSLSVYLSICLSVYLSICLSVYPSIHPSIHPSTHPSIDPSIHPTSQPSMNPSSIYLSMHACMHACMHASIHASIHPSMYPSIHAHRGGVRLREVGRVESLRDDRALQVVAVHACVASRPRCG